MHSQEMAHQISAPFLFILIGIPDYYFLYFSEDMTLVSSSFTFFKNHLAKISCLFSRPRVFYVLFVIMLVNFSCLVIQYQYSMIDHCSNIMSVSLNSGTNLYCEKQQKNYLWGAGLTRNLKY